MNDKFILVLIISSISILAVASPVPITEIVADVAARDPDAEIEQVRGCGQFCL
ncbi:hypothetical protein AN958_11992 [Leucoagaricus sp. SymC.cos]|nr:hypothetical protein AN958_11992 [Leucoagaricus sp. SymC.cos]